jgi:hypothetical protein
MAPVAQRLSKRETMQFGYTVVAPIVNGAPRNVNLHFAAAAIPNLANTPILGCGSERINTQRRKSDLLLLGRETRQMTVKKSSK